MRHAFCVLLCMALALAAQTDRAALTGTVTDPSQLISKTPRVVLKSASTGIERVSTTNATGAYSFTSLPVGQYTASIAAPGFQTLQFEPFTLQVGETRTLNAELHIASVGQSVQVMRLQIPVEAIAEFRASSAVYSAEQGGSAGGQIEVMTKSGANVFQVRLGNSCVTAGSMRPLEICHASSASTEQFWREHRRPSEEEQALLLQLGGLPPGAGPDHQFLCAGRAGHQGSE